MLFGLVIWEQQSEKKLDSIGSVCGSSSELGTIGRKNLAIVVPTLEEVKAVSVFPILMPLSAIFVLNQIPNDKLCHKYTNIFATKKLLLWVVPSCVSFTTVSFPRSLPSHLLLVGLHHRNSPALEKFKGKTSMGGWIKMYSCKVAWIGDFKDLSAGNKEKAIKNEKINGKLTLTVLVRLRRHKHIVTLMMSDMTQLTEMS